MDTVQLDHALHNRDDLPSGVFKGTYAINQIPHAYTVNPPFAMIINTAPWPSRGEHWVAIYCTNINQLEYFDSEGKPPPSRLMMWGHLGNPSIVYNAQRLQSYCSSVCGEYCLFYLYCRMKNVSFTSFLSYFQLKRHISNDRKVYHLVHSVFAILPHNRPFPVFNHFCIQVSRELSSVSRG